MLGYKKGNTKLLTGQIPLHYPGDRVYLDGDTTKTVQDKCARKADLTNDIQSFSIEVKKKKYIQSNRSSKTIFNNGGK